MFTYLSSRMSTYIGLDCQSNAFEVLLICCFCLVLNYFHHHPPLRGIRDPTLRIADLTMCFLSPRMFAQFFPKSVKLSRPEEHIPSLSLSHAVRRPTQAQIFVRPSIKSRPPQQSTVRRVRVGLCPANSFQNYTNRCDRKCTHSERYAIPAVPRSKTRFCSRTTPNAPPSFGHQLQLFPSDPVLFLSFGALSSQTCTFFRAVIVGALQVSSLCRFFVTCCVRQLWQLQQF